MNKKEIEVIAENLLAYPSELAGQWVGQIVRIAQGGSVAYGIISEINHVLTVQETGPPWARRDFKAYNGRVLETTHAMERGDIEGLVQAIAICPYSLDVYKREYVSHVLFTIKSPSMRTKMYERREFTPSSLEEYIASLPQGKYSTTEYRARKLNEFAALF